MALANLRTMFLHGPVLQHVKEGGHSHGVPGQLERFGQHPRKEERAERGSGIQEEVGEFQRTSHFDRPPHRRACSLPR